MKHIGCKLLACMLSTFIICSLFPISALAEIVQTNSPTITNTPMPSATPAPPDVQYDYEQTVKPPEIEMTCTPKVELVFAAGQELIPTPIVTWGITDVTIVLGAGQSYTLPVGGTVDLYALLAGTAFGTVTYAWTTSSASNVSISNSTNETATLTALVPGTSATITVTAVDSAVPATPHTAMITINVTSMSISNSTLSLNGGTTQILTVGNIAADSTTVWTSSNSAVATINASGLVTAAGAGIAVINVTNTPTFGSMQTETCTVTVNAISATPPITEGITGVTITPGAGQSYTIPVGGTVDLTAIATGTAVGIVIYSWSISNASNLSLSDTSRANTTIYGMMPGTSTTITITAIDSASPFTPYTAFVTINVNSLTISNATLSLNGGATQMLTVGNIAVDSTTVWASSNTVVATIDASGLVTAVGAGTAVITVMNEPTCGSYQTKACVVTVSPIITITPVTQSITAANTAGSIQLRVEYGGDLINSASAVLWSNSNAAAGSLTITPTTFTADGPALVCTAIFLSNAKGICASSTITARIFGAGVYTAVKTATVNVRTARYLTLDGDNELNCFDYYGDYTLTLHEANGDVVDDDTSIVHWSWSSSYLSRSSTSLSQYSTFLVDGHAKIKLYARRNTPLGGTRLYAQINSIKNQVYLTINIAGLINFKDLVQSIKLTAPRRSINIGERITIASTVLPSNAKRQLNWFSSNIKIAKVDALGNVTGLAPGSVTITAFSSDRSGNKASIKLNVYRPAPTPIILKY